MGRQAEAWGGGTQRRRGAKEGLTAEGHRGSQREVKESRLKPGEGGSQRRKDAKERVP